ncbi:MAG: SDR family oxidoreductase [Chitinophagaceae bacterium]|nr:MAG: SDR family oxidoreductase [Chitinophagaceae bacterium]
MKTALITGANKGIGFEIAKQLAVIGYRVFMGSRNPEAGSQAIKKLQDAGVDNVEAVQLDVTDINSIAAARKTIGERTSTLDVLINNAGISGGFQQSALETTVEKYHEVYATNVLGVVSVTQAFISLLKNAPEPRIVNVSTSMASLTLAADFSDSAYSARFVVYQSSKTALNMYTVNLAYELRNTAFKVNAVCPGWTQTDFTGHQGTSTVDQAAQRIIKYVMIGNDGPTGKFFSDEYFAGPAGCPW